MKKAIGLVLTSLIIFTVTLASFTVTPVEAKSTSDVLTYKLTINEAPTVVQSWVNEHNTKGIYIMEYNGRYWVYTNAIGAVNNYSFSIESDDNGFGTLTINPNSSLSGDGYALLSCPIKYMQFTAKCGDYSETVNR